MRTVRCRPQPSLAQRRRPLRQSRWRSGIVRSAEAGRFPGRGGNRRFTLASHSCPRTSRRHHDDRLVHPSRRHTQLRAVDPERTPRQLQPAQATTGNKSRSFRRKATTSAVRRPQTARGDALDRVGMVRTWASWIAPVSNTILPLVLRPSLLSCLSRTRQDGRIGVAPVKVGPSACASRTADAAPLIAAPSDAFWQEVRDGPRVDGRQPQPGSTHDDRHILHALECWPRRPETSPALIPVLTGDLRPT